MQLVMYIQNEEKSFWEVERVAFNGNLELNLFSFCHLAMEAFHSLHIKVYVILHRRHGNYQWLYEMFTSLSVRPLSTCSNGLYKLSLRKVIQEALQVPE
jgi:hypothetical protein